MSEKLSDEKLTVLHSDYQICQLGTSNICRQKTIRYVSWEPPIFPPVKLNIDGSSFGKLGRLASVAYFVTIQVIGLQVFQGLVEHQLALKLNYLQCSMVSKKLWNDGCRFNVCASNSKMAFNLVRNSSDRFHLYFSLINMIRDLHILCETNSCTNWLAKYGTNHEDVSMSRTH